MIKSVFIIFLISLSAFAGSETKEFDSKNLHELSIESSAGNIAVKAGEGSAQVTATKKNFSEKCKLVIARAADRLAINVEQERGGNCDVDFEIKVPAAVNVRVALGAGDLQIKGLQGELKFKIGAGNVDAAGGFRKVDGSSGTGSTEIKMTKVPSKGELEVKVGAGSVTAHLPKGTKIKAKLKAGVGQVSNELGDSGDANFSVSLKTGVGSLKVTAD